jgi:hypothetical protein
LLSAGDVELLTLQSLLFYYRNLAEGCSVISAEDDSSHGQDQVLIYETI